MAGKQLKCQVCTLKADKDEMVCEEREIQSGKRKGQFIRQYYHTECYETFLKEKAFKEEERKKLDHLNETIKKAHRIPIVPESFWTYIQDLRNGNFKSKTGMKKKREGIDFMIIAETYEFCQDSINWAKVNRKFDSTLSELKYCLAIVIDKVYLVMKKKKREEFAKAVAEEKNQINQSYFESEQHVNRDITYKKKARRDISHLLD